MPINVRIILVNFLLIMSAGYGFLSAKDDDLAHTLAIGYIALVLTLIVLLDTWKKNDHDDRR